MTTLLYLEKFDVVTCSATTLDIKTIAETENIDIILDQSCFYPRGGGQDWDIGFIGSIDGKSEFSVIETRIDEHGIIHHIGKYLSGQLKVGDKVTCSIDKERRTLNTRLHSAGHVIDFVIDKLQIPWVPEKGAHYAHMSFVEYTGEIGIQQIQSLQGEIEKLCNQTITRGSNNEIRFMPVSEMHAVCRHIPTNIPSNKPARVVMYFDNFGIPCGGTHVRNVSDIGPMGIKKIKKEKNRIKVSYELK